VAAIKARSEDVLAEPDDVFSDVLDDLRAGYAISESRRLDRFHDDHLAVVAEPRPDGEGP
jgi:fibrillarin-like pre-rRNA processing protein